ncbi:unnamed protein product, partial [Trichogramma brassicae]
MALRRIASRDLTSSLKYPPASRSDMICASLALDLSSERFNPVRLLRLHKSSVGSLARSTHLKEPKHQSSPSRAQYSKVNSLETPHGFEKYSPKNNESNRWLERHYHRLKWNHGVVSYDKLGDILKKVLRNADSVYVKENATIHSHRSNNLS